MTKPIKDLHPHATEPGVYTNELASFSALISEVVNFGTHILSWDALESTGEDENMPRLLMFRHVLELLDSISILVKESSIEPCKPILRSILETYFQLEYLMQEDSRNRALGFMIWDLHQELRVAKALVKSDPSYEILKKKIEKDKTLSEKLTMPVVEGLDDHIQNIEKRLSHPLYSEMELLYQQKVTSAPKGSNAKHWFGLFGDIKSIEQLAEKIERQGLYEMFYRPWSGATHGTKIFYGRIVAMPGGVGIVQIRNPVEAQAVAQNAVLFAQLIYNLICTKSIPNHQQDFLQWYTSTISEELLRITNETIIKRK